MDNRQITPLHVPSLLEKYGLRPSKGLGQNFLLDDNALRKVVDVAEISEGDMVLEVGAGLGNLTRYLAAAAQKVIAVELDQKLLPVLHETLAPFDNIEIVMGDILELDPVELFIDRSQPSSASGPPPYKVVANIPYYITSALIRHLLEADHQPSCLVLTVQREVAQRICEKPPKMSLLALSVQVYGEPQIAAKISKGAFYPKPNVDSAIVKINLYPSPQIPKSLLPNFFQLAKAGFGQKRKTLRNALSAGVAWPKEQATSILEEAGIDPQRRAQTLSLEEWGALTQAANPQMRTPTDNQESHRK